MARRFAKVSEEIEEAFFYPSDLVNTKTTIPLRVGEERWIYTSTLRVSVYIHHYSPPLRGIVVYYIKILESEWSSAGLISAVIVQLHTSCACNWTVVRVIKLSLVALEWLFFSACSLEVEYINRSNSLNHCHILLEFCYSYD